VGTQASFRKKKPSQTYRYDSSLSPALPWDAQNSNRELGEWLIGLIEEASRLEPPHEFPEPRQTTIAGRNFQVRGLRDAAAQLKALSRPFLDWAPNISRYEAPRRPARVISFTRRHPPPRGGHLAPPDGRKRKRSFSVRNHGERRRSAWRSGPAGKVSTNCWPGEHVSRTRPGTS
jgi:hypothetical protein